MTRTGAVVVVALAGLLAPSAVRAEAIDVAPGDDVSAAVRRAAPGDEVRLHRGVYGALGIWGLHGTADRPITIVSIDGPAQAVLEGGDETLRIGDASSFLVIDGLEVRGARNNVVHIDGGSHHITLRRVRAHHAGLDGDVIKINQCSFIRIEAVDASFPGRRPDDPDNPYQECLDMLDVDDSVVRRSFIHDGGNQLMFVKGGSRRVVLEENVFRGNDPHAAQEPCVGIGGASDRELLGREIFEVTDVSFVNNVVAECHSGGLGLYDAHTVYVAHNAFVDVDRVVVEVRFAGAPAARSEDVDITANVFLDTRGRMPALYARQAERDVRGLRVSHNAYWNAGRPLTSGDLFDVSHEDGAVRADPRLRHQDAALLAARTRREVFESLRPRAGSPLIDAAATTRATRDAVGCGRPIGPSADIGPFEVDSSAPPVPEG